LEINLVRVGRTGGRVDRVAVSGVYREVVDQRPMLRDRDAELQKPFIDGDSVVDGDDGIVAKIFRRTCGAATVNFGRDSVETALRKTPAPCSSWSACRSRPLQHSLGWSRS